MISRIKPQMWSVALAAGLALGAGESIAPAQEAPRPDSAKVLHRFDFERDISGWSVEKGEDAKTTNVVEHVKTEFRGSSGALRGTVPNRYQGIGSVASVSYPGKDTKVTVIYKTRECNALRAQGMAKPAGKQLHGNAPGFRDGAWAVTTIDVAKFSPWGGNEVGSDQEFSTLMIFASVRGEARQPEVLLDQVVVWQGTDTTPPEPVTQAEGSVDLQAGEVVLKWTAPADNIAVAQFHVFRSLSEDPQADDQVALGQTADTVYRDGAINNFGTYYYRIVAEDASGNRGEASKPIKVVVKP